MMSQASLDRDCPICKGVGFFRYDLAVGHPDFGKAIPCPHKVAEMAQSPIQEYGSTNGLALYSHMTFENFKMDNPRLSIEERNRLRNAYTISLNYSSEPKGWLIFRGGYGVGKTHLAAAIANERVSMGLPVLFLTAPDLLDELRSTFSSSNDANFSERFESVRTSPFLVIDDYGTQANTAWAWEKIFQLIDYRYSAKLPTVITTNRDIDDLDPRIRSRMLDLGLTQVVDLSVVPDYRLGQARSGFELSSLLFYEEMTFASFDVQRADLTVDQNNILQDALENAKRYAASSFGWLIINGAYGSGKTHLAAAISNEVLQRGDSVLFVFVPDLLDHLRSTFAPHSEITFDKTFVEIRNAPFLVLDHLDMENASSWAKEKLFQIVNYRYAARLRTIFTVAENSVIDDRIKARLLDRGRGAGINLAVPGYHRRQMKLGTTQGSYRRKVRPK